MYMHSLLHVQLFVEISQTSFDCSKFYNVSSLIAAVNTNQLKKNESLLNISTSIGKFRKEFVDQSTYNQ